MLVRWDGGGLHNVGRTQHTPVDVTFSPWRAGMGSLDDAVDALLLGRTVRIDMRADNYLVVQRKCRERIHATD